MTEEKRKKENNRKLKISLLLVPILMMLLAGLAAESYSISKVRETPFAFFSIRNLNYTNVFDKTLGNGTVSSLIDTGHALTPDDISQRRRYLLSPTGYTAYDRDDKELYSVKRDWITTDFPRDFLFSEFAVARELTSLTQVTTQIDPEILEAFKTSVTSWCNPRIMELSVSVVSIVMLLVVWGLALWAPSRGVVNALGLSTVLLILVKWVVSVTWNSLRENPTSVLGQVFQQHFEEWGLSIGVKWVASEILISVTVFENLVPLIGLALIVREKLFDLVSEGAEANILEKESKSIV